MNVGRQPTGFAKLAWNVLKFTNMYAAKKKFDINGAIAFNSPIKMNLWRAEAREWNMEAAGKKHSRNGNDECQHVATKWFIVFSVTPCEPFDFRIQLVLAQCLNAQRENRKLNLSFNELRDIDAIVTWKTFGADTRLAKADDSVAAKHPA